MDDKIYRYDVLELYFTKTRYCDNPICYLYALHVILCGHESHAKLKQVIFLGEDIDSIKRYAENIKQFLSNEMFIKYVNVRWQSPFFVRDIETTNFECNTDGSLKIFNSYEFPIIHYYDPCIKKYVPIRNDDPNKKMRYMFRRRCFIEADLMNGKWELPTIKPIISYPTERLDIEDLTNSAKFKG